MSRRYKVLEVLQTDVFGIARKMRGPGGAGRVLVLDVDCSSRKYGIALGPRASRHAYYLRPPEGMHATDLKQILDEAGGEEELILRYYIYPELQTDLKPLLSADPYAEKYFGRNDDRRFLQLEGERPQARETIAELLEGLKDPFKPEDFPRINEFFLGSFKPGSDSRRAEAVLLRKDGERDELRKSEPGFHIAVAEHGFAREIDIHRPVVAETEPAIILTSNEHTRDSGLKFLAELAAYFRSEAYAERSKIADEEAAELQRVAIGMRVPSSVHHVSRAPTLEPAKLDDQQLVTKVADAMRALLPSMSLLKKREVSRRGPYITMQFPGVLGFGKGPSAKEMQELASIFRAIRADPSFGTGWQAHYELDRKTGEMRIATSFNPASSRGWTAL